MTELNQTEYYENIIANHCKNIWKYQDASVLVLDISSYPTLRALQNLHLLEGRDMEDTLRGNQNALPIKVTNSHPSLNSILNKVAHHNITAQTRNGKCHYMG